MAYTIYDGFNLNFAAPIDYRMIAANDAARNSITWKYDGMKVFQLDNRLTYIWNSSSSTWSIETTISATGSTNYIPRVTATSPYISYGNSAIYDNGLGPASGSAVGINTNNPKEYLQIGSYPVAFSGQSLPLVFHKGSNTRIGYNWYYNNGNQYFDITKGSSLIQFGGYADPTIDGSITLNTREPNAPNFNAISFYMKNGKVMIGNLSTIQNDALGTYGPIFLVSGDSSNSDLPLFAIMNTSNVASDSKNAMISFWGRSVGNVNQRVADIYSQVRGNGSDLGNWTKSSLVFSVIPRNSNGNLISIDGNNSWNKHTFELREDGQFYIGPNFPAGSPSNISGGSALFSNAKPKLDIISGLTSSGYNECIVLRHPTISQSAATRRLGFIMKLSSETLSEYEKMGGIILESTEEYANNPSLSLVLSEQKRFNILNNGKINIFSPEMSMTQNASKIGLFNSKIGSKTIHTNLPQSSSTIISDQIVTGLISCVITIEVVLIVSASYGRSGFQGCRCVSIIKSFRFNNFGNATTIGTANTLYDVSTGVNNTNQPTIVNPDINASNGNISLDVGVSSTNSQSVSFSLAYYYKYTII
jgi:hypothetical protein